MASSPLKAVETLCPSLESTSWSRSMVTGSSSTTKRRADALFIGFIPFKDGEGYQKRASLPHFTFNLDPSEVFFDNLLTDCQSQSRAFPHLFRSKKGFENSLL